MIDLDRIQDNREHGALQSVFRITEATPCTEQRMTLGAKELRMLRHLIDEALEPADFARPGGQPTPPLANREPAREGA